MSTAHLPRPNHDGDDQPWWLREPDTVNLGVNGAIGYHKDFTYLEKQPMETIRNHYWALREKVGTIMGMNAMPTSDLRDEASLVASLPKEDLIAICRHFWITHYHQNILLAKLRGAAIDI